LILYEVKNKMFYLSSYSTNDKLEIRIDHSVLDTSAGWRVCCVRSL